MWRLQAIEAGQLETARNHEQTWDALMSLLDEYVTVYGESSFDFTTFQEIFVSGLEGLHYSKVPTAIDQVQVRAMDLTRRRCQGYFCYWDDGRNFSTKD